ncbi:MAG TPA: hypothetical protein VJ955_08065 [Desulfuromonadales bacterium]|nr:hypothetical protein [Desulfuromonadales bacterium]
MVGRPDARHCNFDSVGIGAACVCAVEIGIVYLGAAAQSLDWRSAPVAFIADAALIA